MSKSRLSRRARLAYNPGVELAVLTYNIYNHADFDRRLPLIIEAIRGCNADLVALQEVPPGREFVPELARLTGFGHHAEATFVRPDDGWSETLAVLSRYAIAQSEGLDLRPGVSNCLRARIETPAGPVGVYDAHLHPRDSELRQREARIILDRIESEPAVPAVLCGDLNAVPTGKTLRLIFEKLRSAYELFHDLHPETTFPTPLRPDVLQSTTFGLRQEGQPRAPHAEARAALDYVLVRPSDFSVREARLVGDRPASHDAALWPSDHYGVFVRLSRD